MRHPRKYNALYIEYVSMYHRAHHHCGVLVEWVDPGLGSWWPCWSPHRCSCQHLRAPLLRCTDSPSPERWIDDCLVGQIVGIHWRSTQMSALEEKGKQFNLQQCGATVTCSGDDWFHICSIRYIDLYGWDIWTERNVPYCGLKMLAYHIVFLPLSQFSWEELLLWQM